MGDGLVGIGTETEGVVVDHVSVPLKVPSIGSEGEETRFSLEVVKAGFCSRGEVGPRISVGGSMASAGMLI